MIGVDGRTMAVAVRHCECSDLGGGGGRQTGGSCDRDRDKLASCQNWQQETLWLHPS